MQDFSTGQNFSGEIAATATQDGQLYKLETQAALLIQNGISKACIHVWHRRMGHRHPEAVKQLVNNELAEGIKLNQRSEPAAVCESCIEGKMARQPFPSSMTKADRMLDLIYTDVCGPMQTQTPGKARYVMTLVDDYSRYTVVCLLKKKSEVFERIKDFVRLCETKYNRKPKKFRSDNGGEYIGHDVKDFLRRESIEWQLTVPFSPQQNGVAERKNRSLTEMARCMLQDAQLPNRFWGEAVLTATYLQNRLPSRAIS